MTILTETQAPLAFLLSEASGTRSRDQIIIYQGSGSARVLTAGMVIAIHTASGDWVQHDQDGADGSEVAKGVLGYDITAADGADNPGGLGVVRDAEVNANKLVWQSDIEAGEIATAVAELAAVGIIVRS